MAVEGLYFGDVTVLWRCGAVRHELSRQTAVHDVPDAVAVAVAVAVGYISAYAAIPYVLIAVSELVGGTAVHCFPVAALRQLLMMSQSEWQWKWRELKSVLRQLFTTVQWQ